MAQRLVSGIKPTGSVHIGNYFGAMQQFLQLQDSYESCIFIADLHALNQVHDPEALRANILEIATAYLAVGLDPEKVSFYRQSEIPLVSELTWILSSITSLGLLERAHAYKDLVAKGGVANLGLFSYPVLMAADILLYQADIVPVGNDQQQHLEICIDLAERFNHLFGTTFTIPKPFIHSATATVPGLDGQKMSKSYKNVIGLFDPPELVNKKVAGIPTDSRGQTEPKDPTTCHIFALHRLFSQEKLPELEKRYLDGSISYKESKDILAAAINQFLEPIRARKAELDARPAYVQDILEAGRQKVLPLATHTLDVVKQKVGLL